MQRIIDAIFQDKKKSNAHSTNFTYEMLWTWTVHLMTTKLLHKHCAHIKICALHRLHYHIIHLNMQPFHRTVKWMNGNGKRSWVVNDENSHNMQTTSCYYHTISYHFHNSTQFYSEPLLGPGLLSLPPSYCIVFTRRIKNMSRNWIYDLAFWVVRWLRLNAVYFTKAFICIFNMRTALSRSK